MIKALEIRQYKNLHKQTFKFGKVNKIIGENGVGKTSIREAIEFLCFGKVNQKKPSFNCSVAGFINGVRLIRSLHNGEENIMLGAKRVKQGAVESVLKIDYLEFLSSFGMSFMKLDEDDKHNLLIGKFATEPSFALIKGWWMEQKLGGTKEWQEFHECYPLDDPEAMEKLVEKEAKAEKAEYDFNQGELAATLEAINKIQIAKAIGKSNPKLVARMEKIQRNIDLIKKYSQPPFNEDLLKTLGIEPYDFDATNIKINKLLKEQTEAEVQYDALNKLTDICPTCHQKIKNINIEEVKRERIKLKQRKEKAKAKHDAAVEEKIAKRQRIIKALAALISSWESKLASLKEKSGGSDAKLIEFQKQQKNELKKKQEEIEKKLEENKYEFLQNLLKFVRTIPLQQTKGIVKEVNEALGKGFELVLAEKNKTNDNYKKVFKVYKNGIDYAFLSTGQQMYVDMVFAKIFMGESSMLFIDNAESYTGKILKTKQVFLAYAIKDKPLTVKRLDA